MRIRAVSAIIIYIISSRVTVANREGPLLFGGPEWKFSSAAQGIFQLGQGPVASCSALDRDLKILGTRLHSRTRITRSFPGPSFVTNTLFWKFRSYDVWSLRWGGGARRLRLLLV